MSSARRVPEERGQALALVVAAVFRNSARNWAAATEIEVAEWRSRLGRTSAAGTPARHRAGVRVALARVGAQAGKGCWAGSPEGLVPSNPVGNSTGYSLQ